jgi:uncharacterized protein YgfB (UPF0149 family)
MIDQELPEFDEVQSALDRLRAITDASEAHGTLCGLLLGHKEMSKWLSLTLESLPDKSDLLAQEDLRLMEQLFEQSKVQLNADDMSLQLLLPDESHEFAIRLIGLASWCRGFLYGLAANGESILKALSEQGLECMNDLLEISQLGYDEDETDETEVVYSEIIEHVRLSVIYMNDEINPLLPSSQLH